MIRKATAEDLPELLRMGKAFHAVTGVAEAIPLDEPTLERTFAQLIESGVILVIEEGGGLVGATGALLHPHYFNASHITGQELFWWIDPDHRGRGSELLNALEAWVKDQGAHSFVMITLEALEPERVGLIYRRRGYRPVEHSYLKEM
jgi:GNAT superfamily N-acetyltransferase